MQAFLQGCEWRCALNINEKNKRFDGYIIDITEEYVKSKIIKRPQDSHKGTFGKVLCIAGSFRYRGAAALAVEGALRGGCGIVTLASVEPVFASVQPRLPEAILLSCKPDEVGGIGASNAAMLIEEAIKDQRAVLMGPGMGNTESTSILVKEIVSSVFASYKGNSGASNSGAGESSAGSSGASNSGAGGSSAGSSGASNSGAGESCTVVLDADALNAIPAAGLTIGEIIGMKAASAQSSDAGENTGKAASAQSAGAGNDTGKVGSAQDAGAGNSAADSCGSRLIITPHPGEMARLCGCTIADIKADREKIITDFARENNCVVVLKEHRTLIALPDGRIYRNTTGNSGLARGGSGDILAGMTASFAASGMSAEDAAVCAVWMHGKSAELTSERKSQTAMLPHDIFEDMGKLFLSFEKQV